MPAADVNVDDVESLGFISKISTSLLFAIHCTLNGPQGFKVLIIFLHFFITNLLFSVIALRVYDFFRIIRFGIIL